MSEKFYEVAVAAPLPTALTYSFSEKTLPPGTAVSVPLGKRKAKGVILKETTETPSGFQLKSVSEVISEIVIPEKTLNWVKWVANYYQHPIGQVAWLMHPPLKKAVKERKSNRSPVVPDIPYSAPPELTEEQTKVLKDIQAFQGFSSHLLHGVTGSGKTEVYLHLMAEALKQKKKALFLVPEISLTPQLVHRIAARFPNEVALIHSQLTEREKTNQWWSMIDNEKSILVGARSALFCPIDDIGLIVVDEEHEPSFKQDEKLKYNGRDAAVVLAKQHDCPIILGSATPSLESWQNTQNGKFQLHQMKNRVSDRQLPLVSVVDMKTEREARKEKNKDDLPFWLSTQLYEEIKETLEEKKQVALFLNRRGIAQVISCMDCGYVYECPNCAISLTLHAQNHLVCHYCDYSEVLKQRCTQCDSDKVSPYGLGTELVEEDIKKLFPEAVAARADRDEVQSRDDLEELIFAMEKNEINILIGTQMIAKGLDFPSLQLVGLIMADISFNIPDFRSSERSFQLLTQVSGRAGRHSEKPGRVVIQTYTPEHKSILHAINHDFESFAKEELVARKELNYPPFGKLTSLKIQGLDHDKVKFTADKMAHRAHSLKEARSQYQNIFILGPSQAAISKIRGKFRYHLLIKATDHNSLRHFCTELMADLKLAEPGTKVQIDVDPLNML